MGMLGLGLAEGHTSLSCYFITRRYRKETKKNKIHSVRRESPIARLFSKHYVMLYSYQADSTIQSKPADRPMSMAARESRMRCLLLVSHGCKARVCSFYAAARLRLFSSDVIIPVVPTDLTK